MKQEIFERVFEVGKKYIKEEWLKSFVYKKEINLELDFENYTHAVEIYWGILHRLDGKVGFDTKEFFTEENIFKLIKESVDEYMKENEPDIVYSVKKVQKYAVIQCIEYKNKRDFSKDEMAEIKKIMKKYKEKYLKYISKIIRSAVCCNEDAYFWFGRYIDEYDLEKIFKLFKVAETNQGKIVFAYPLFEYPYQIPFLYDELVDENCILKGYAL